MSDNSNGRLDYLKGVVYIHDCEFVYFAESHGKTEEELINDIVELGFTCGMDDDGEYEYWAPDKEKKED